MNLNMKQKNELKPPIFPHNLWITAEKLWKTDLLLTIQWGFINEK